MWNDIKDAAKTPINGIIEFINGLIKGIYSGVNAIMRALNKIKVDIPEWVPGFGGKTFGFNLQEVTPPQIPTLAAGGIAYDNALVEVAEYSGSRSNPEVIAPLDKLAGLLRGVTDGAGGGNVTNNITVVLEDGTVVGRTTQIMQRNQRLGLQGV